MYYDVLALDGGRWYRRQAEYTRRLDQHGARLAPARTCFGGAVALRTQCLELCRWGMHDRELRAALPSADRAMLCEHYQLCDAIRRYFGDGSVRIALDARCTYVLDWYAHRAAAHARHQRMQQRKKSATPV